MIGLWARLVRDCCRQLLSARYDAIGELLGLSVAAFHASIRNCHAIGEAAVP
jgi:hypothetical protein